MLCGSWLRETTLGFKFFFSSLRLLDIFLLLSVSHFNLTWLNDVRRTLPAPSAPTQTPIQPGWSWPCHNWGTSSWISSLGLGTTTYVQELEWRRNRKGVEVEATVRCECEGEGIVTCEELFMFIIITITVTVTVGTQPDIFWIKRIVVRTSRWRQRQRLVTKMAQIGSCE